ncbi:MAG: Lrp/AsnC family transcriptional regulator [Paracoccaceae bacterium]|nr:Lrp/AsnC family transcriptional regulator [Paracoccaceae bacterium]
MQVHLERERTEHLESFKKRMLEAPDAMQCYYVTGSSDFVFLITAQNMEEYELFTCRHFMEHSNVAHFYTDVVMDRVKFSLAMPIVTDEP